MPSVKAPTILAIGEFVWDCLPTGDCLGGAPANLLAHACALGARGILVSAIGTDPAGDRALKEISKRGIDTRFITRLPDIPTGLVTVEMDAHGHHQFTIGSPAAWDHPEISESVLATAATADAIIFGTLGQRTPGGHEATRRLLAASGENTLRICDANFRAPHDDHALLSDLLATSTDILKINDEELAVYAPGETPRQFFDRHPQLAHLIYTRGPAGTLLLARGSDGTIHSSDLPAPPTKIADTVGAGDSYTAAFLTGLLAGLPLPEINRRAIQIAAYVCTQPGATPDLTPAIQQLADT